MDFKKLPVMPLKNVTTADAMKGLRKSLEDEDYKRGWVANIAMAYIDNENWYRGEFDIPEDGILNYEQKHAIANRAAEHFIWLLCK